MFTNGFSTADSREEYLNGHVHDFTILLIDLAYYKFTGI